MGKGPLTFKQSDVVRAPVYRAKNDQFQLRLPDGMRTALKAIAASNNRSLNSEIVAILAAAISPGDDPMKRLERNLVEALTIVQQKKEGKDG